MATKLKITGVEVVSAVVLIGVITGIFFLQQQTLDALNRDVERKVSLNTIQANLEEVVKPRLKGYPRVLKAAQLTAMDSRLLRDPSGAVTNAAGSDLQYEPTGCNGSDICSGYTLSAKMEREAKYTLTDPTAEKNN